MGSFGGYLLFALVPVILILRSAWFKGQIGEFKVNFGMKLLLNRDVFRLFKNVTLPFEDGTTQIDHLVISPFGIFVVETKNMNGWIFGSSNQERWTQQLFRKKFQFQNPLRQNYAHVKAVQDMLGLDQRHVFNVIVFLGGCKLKTAMPDEVRNGVFDLVTFIKSKRDPLLAEQDLPCLIETLMKHRLDPGFRTRRLHLRNIKRRAADRKLKAKSCPRCGSTMIERTNAKSGELFLGCRHYPQCTGTRSLS
ncbi:MAG TPA: nuclease [Rhodospirillaceae bacterium]|nr:nuclease [Rhodospirillaceae bacterium]MAX63848.1 nuclease [Rhodospirillaceae bacterium]MBB57282.1 nuclease [Rhodospirillaceae bacterium]HAJ22240.1 nuclease [Rhodospirillaceae bacterium]HBM11154.1 nuclease [Rhodospirillaceae bacterium]|tara:strand:+ start:1770 stop:2519 length:750 start_codon:yes stop_codon:yes gene_type:complete